MARTIKVTPKVLQSFHPSKRAREDPSKDPLTGSKSFSAGLHHQITSCPGNQSGYRGRHLLANTAEYVLACSGARRNIPQEANCIPSVSIAHVNLCVSHDPCDVTLIHNQVILHWHFGHDASAGTSEAISSLCFITCRPFCPEEALGPDLGLNIVVLSTGGGGEYVKQYLQRRSKVSVQLRLQWGSFPSAPERDIPSKSEMYSSRKRSERTRGASLSSPARPSLLTPGQSYICTPVTFRHSDDWNEIWLRLLLHLHSH